MNNADILKLLVWDLAARIVWARRYLLPPAEFSKSKTDSQDEILHEMITSISSLSTVYAKNVIEKVDRAFSDAPCPCSSIVFASQDYVAQDYVTVEKDSARVFVRCVVCGAVAEVDSPVTFDEEFKKKLHSDVPWFGRRHETERDNFGRITLKKTTNGGGVLELLAAREVVKAAKVALDNMDMQNLRHFVERYDKAVKNEEGS